MRWAEPGSLGLDSYSSSPGSARSWRSGTPASIAAPQTELCQNHAGNRDTLHLLRFTSDPAAIVHADQRLGRLRDGVLGAQTHGAGRSRARRRLRVSKLQASGHDEAFSIICVSLHQQVCVPLTVDEKMLRPILVQAERL